MHPITYQPVGPKRSHLQRLGFAIGFVWFALGIILAFLMLVIQGFAEEASQPPPSLADRAIASAILLLIASPGLLLAVILRRKQRS